MKRRTSIVCGHCNRERSIPLEIHWNAIYCKECKPIVHLLNSKKRREANPERVRASAREATKRYRSANKEVGKQRISAWLKTPAGKAYKRQKARRRETGMKAASNMVRHFPELRVEINTLYREAVISGMEVDHIYPLVHERVCGLHVPWNLRLATKSENSRKQNKLPEEIGLII